MIKNKQTLTIIVIAVALVLFASGMLTQKVFPIFAIQTNWDCAGWLHNQGLDGSVAPFNWGYTSTQMRCVTALTPYGMGLTGSNAPGCRVDYIAGACTVVPNPTPTPTPSPSPSPSVCTMDAKLCSDGSYVSRVAPSCAFAACPNSTPSPSIPPKTSSSMTWIILLIIGGVLLFALSKK